MDIALSVIALFAVCAWLASAASCLMMLKFRDRTRSLAWFAFHGIAFFTGDGFGEEAKPWRRRFLIGAGVFLACCVAGVAVGALASSSASR